MACKKKTQTTLLLTTLIINNTKKTHIMKARHSIVLAGLFMLASTMNSCTNGSANMNHSFGIESRYNDFRDSKEWGKVTTNEISTAPFSGIDTNGCADVDFYQDDEVSVVIIGNEKAVALYDVDVQNDMLTIRMKNGSNKGWTPAVLVEVHAPALWKIHNKGTGDLDLKNTVKLEADLLVDAVGTGDVDIDGIRCHKICVNHTGTGDMEMKKVKCDVVEIASTGTGDVELEAKAKKVTATISGTGDANLKVDHSQEVAVIAKGTGDVDLKVHCEALDIQANGSCTVEAKGSCTTLTKQREGLATIRTKNLSVSNLNLMD